MAKSPNPYKVDLCFRLDRLAEGNSLTISMQKNRHAQCASEQSLFAEVQILCRIAEECLLDRRSVQIMCDEPLSVDVH